MIDPQDQMRQIRLARQVAHLHEQLAWTWIIAAIGWGIAAILAFGAL